jgi:hypothetical protein
MPVFDAKGRISADDISVGSGSSSGRRGGGGGGGGGGGTLADALEEQILSNGRFYQEFNDVHAQIGFEAQYLRTFEGQTNESLGRIGVDLSETEAYLEAVIEHNYTDLQGQITTSQAGLQSWANNEFAKATMLANYYTKDETGTLVSSSSASVIAYADNKFAQATLVAQMGNDIASIEIAVDSLGHSVASIRADYVRIDSLYTYVSGWLNTATVQANTLYAREIIVQNSFQVQPYTATWKARSVCTALNDNTAYLLSSGTSGFSVVTGVNFSTKKVTTKYISNVQRTYVKSGTFSTINYLGR